MPTTPRYRFIVSMDVKPEYEDIFNEVYDTEHVLNICNVAGVTQPIDCSWKKGCRVSVARHWGRVPHYCRNTWRFMSWSVVIFQEAMPGPHKPKLVGGRRKFSPTRSTDGMRYEK
jgi:hypothetical protein